MSLSLQPVSCMFPRSEQHTCPDRGLSILHSSGLRGHARSASSKKDPSWTYQRRWWDFAPAQKVVNGRGLTTSSVPYSRVSLEFPVWKQPSFKLSLPAVGWKLHAALSAQLAARSWEGSQARAAAQSPAQPQKASWGTGWGGWGFWAQDQQSGFCMRISKWLAVWRSQL